MLTMKYSHDKQNESPLGGFCMKGYIGSREKCSVCQGRLVHDERRKGCYCIKHPNIRAQTYYVKFGRDIYRRFKEYEPASRFLNGLRFKSDEGSFDKRDYPACSTREQTCCTAGTQDE